MVRNKKVKLYNIKMFLYASLSGLKLNLGGQLGFNEILAVLDSFSLSSWKALYVNVPDMKKINIAYLVLLVAQMLSDVINHSSMQNAIRGWANIGMAIIVTNFLARMLWKEERSVITYLLGVIVSIVFFGSETEGVSLEDMGFFKFRLVPILNAALMVTAWYFIRKMPRFQFNIVLLFLAYGLFNIAFDSRSNGLIFILISGMIYKRNLFLSLTFKRAVPYLLVFACLFQGLYSLYVMQVQSGNIGGEHAKRQFALTKNMYNPINLLLVGRAEVYAAISAIIDRPLTGHGSWAVDPGGKYTFIAYQLHGEDDKFVTDMRNMEGELIIPSHSVIFGAWMTSGILGLFAVLYIIFLFYKRAFGLLKQVDVLNSPYFPIVVLYLITGAWTFLFSPLPHIKQTLPIMIAFIIVTYNRVNNT